MSVAMMGGSEGGLVSGYRYGGQYIKTGRDATAQVDEGWAQRIAKCGPPVAMDSCMAGIVYR
jgi:hypothetical protein